MKKITIFLASSIAEFSRERTILRAFCADLGDLLDDYQYEIEMFACETYDKAIQNTRTQEKYNEFIKGPCDIFMNLYGVKAGKYTKEEMEVAMATYEIYQKPLIHIGFTTDIDDCEDKELHSIYNYAKESSVIQVFDYEHHTTNSIIQLKLALLKAIHQCDPSIEITIKEKGVFVFGERIM